MDPYTKCGIYTDTDISYSIFLLSFYSVTFEVKEKKISRSLDVYKNLKNLRNLRKKVNATIF